MIITKMWLICILMTLPGPLMLNQAQKGARLEDLRDMPFNPASIETFKGEVLDVQQVYFVNRPTPYIQVILKTAEGEFSVELAPEWYLQTQGMALLPKEEIEVVGSIVLVNGRPLIIAAQIKNRSGGVIQLRDGNGYPLW